MDNDDQLKMTEKIVMCDKCGCPTIQSEVDENDGDCLNCNEKFEPSNQSKEF